MERVKLSMQALCNSNKDAEVKLSVHNEFGVELNEVKTTVNEIANGKHVLQAADNTSLTIVDFKQFIVPTFVDYLRSGWNISLVCAIDYTASNGNSSSPSSLHYLGPQNQYE